MHRFQEDFRSGKNDYQVYFLPSTKCDFFVRKLEIVMIEMRKLKMSADFLQIHPIIFVGVQECKELLYIDGM